MNSHGIVGVMMMDTSSCTAGACKQDIDKRLASYWSGHVRLGYQLNCMVAS